MLGEILVLLGSIGRSHLVADAIGLNCGIWKAKEDKTLRSPWVVGAWRVFCYLCTPTLFSSGSISTWTAAVRFFAKFFGFHFDNMSWCSFVFASLPYSLSFHFIVDYG